MNTQQPLVTPVRTAGEHGARTGRQTPAGAGYRGLHLHEPGSRSARDVRYLCCPHADCGHLFRQKNALDRHLRAHNRVPGQCLLFPCPAQPCRRQFQHQASLTLHLLCAHNHKQHWPLTCPHENCHKHFVHKGSLTRHLRTHSLTRPLPCPHAGCKAQFFFHAGLNRHLLTHSRMRPFACRYEGCTKRFIDSGNAAAHLRIHWKEKPFVCPHEGCDRQFSHRGNLKKHRCKNAEPTEHSCPSPRCRSRCYGSARRARPLCGRAGEQGLAPRHKHTGSGPP